MNFRELRNRLISSLWDYIGCPVILSNQVQPEAEPPFCIYTVTAPYISDGGMGLQGNCTKITINNLLSAALQTTIYFFRITGHLFLRFSSLPWHMETSQLFKWTSSPSIDYQNLLFSWLYSNPALFSFWTSISF